MSARNFGLFLVILVSGGCTAQPLASPAAVPSTASPSSEPSPSAPTASPSTEASVEPTVPVATLPAATPAAGVPAEVGRFAWAGMREETQPDGSNLWHIYGGLLNHAPGFTSDVLTAEAYPHLTTGLDLVAIGVPSAGRVSFSVRQAVDGGEIDTVATEGVEIGPMAIDAERGLLYAGIVLQGGGVEIRRFALDRDSSNLLLSLDDRFTPEGIATERYDFELDPDGVLVVEACGKTDGCRLWEIPPTAARASAPRTLPGHPPIVCYMAGATRDWIVVADDDVCFADTGDARLPIRAIRRADGVSHVITDDHVAIGRIVEAGAKVLAVGTRGTGAGFPVDIVSYDVTSGKASILVQQIEPGPADVWLDVSSTAVPSPWVLLEADFVEAAALPSIPARIVNVRTHESIELPIGMSGWS